jgi:uncharacterized protein YaaN involved in tellurite resistance
MPSTEITLTPPEPVTPVAPAQTAGMVPIDPDALPDLDATALAFVDRVVELDPNDPQFAATAESIRTMGDADIRAAAEVSNRLLQRPVQKVPKGGAGDGEKVSDSLIELRRTIERLDPKQASGIKKVIGKVPGSRKLRNYFHRYESAQSHIDAILHALYRGQDELRRDNAALDQEKVHLWDTMQRLGQYVYVAERLDAALAARISTVEDSDPERAKRLRDDVLFYARQKHQDLLTQLAVSIQGYLAIDLVRRNNVELVKGVDRATTTTIAALRTAVLVAQALANQRLVLNQITALSATTSNLVESTSAMLADNTGSINARASSATIGIDQLRKAFDNVYAAMDAIDTFKQQALIVMQSTVDALEAEVTRAQPKVAKVAAASGTTNAPALSLPVAP